MSFCVDAREIHNVWRDRMLSPKPAPELIATKFLPQRAFRVAHAPTQILTALCQRRFAAHAPTLPPPRAGEGDDWSLYQNPATAEAPANRRRRARDIDRTYPAATGARMARSKPKERARPCRSRPCCRAAGGCRARRAGAGRSPIGAAKVVSYST